MDRIESLGVLFEELGNGHNVTDENLQVFVKSRILPSQAFRNHFFERRILSILSSISQVIDFSSCLLNRDLDEFCSWNRRKHSELEDPCRNIIINHPVIVKRLETRHKVPNLKEYGVYDKQTIENMRRYENYYIEDIEFEHGKSIIAKYLRDFFEGSISRLKIFFSFCDLINRYQLSETSNNHIEELVPHFRDFFLKSNLLPNPPHDLLDLKNQFLKYYGNPEEKVKIVESEFQLLLEKYETGEEVEEDDIWKYYVDVIYPLQVHSMFKKDHIWKLLEFGMKKAIDFHINRNILFDRKNDDDNIITSEEEEHEEQVIHSKIMKLIDTCPNRLQKYIISKCFEYVPSNNRKIESMITRIYCELSGHDDNERNKNNKDEMFLEECFARSDITSALQFAFTSLRSLSHRVENLERKYKRKYEGSFPFLFRKELKVRHFAEICKKMHFNENVCSKTHNVGYWCKEMSRIFNGKNDGGERSMKNRQDLKNCVSDQNYFGFPWKEYFIHNNNNNSKSEPNDNHVFNFCEKYNECLRKRRFVKVKNEPKKGITYEEIRTEFYKRSFKYIHSVFSSSSHPHKCSDNQGLTKEEYLMMSMVCGIAIPFSVRRRTSSSSSSSSSSTITNNNEQNRNTGRVEDDQSQFDVYILAGFQKNKNYGKACQCGFGTWINIIPRKKNLYSAVKETRRSLRGRKELVRLKMDDYDDFEDDDNSLFDGYDRDLFETALRSMRTQIPSETMEFIKNPDFDNRNTEKMEEEEEEEEEEEGMRSFRFPFFNNVHEFFNFDLYKLFVNRRKVKFRPGYFHTFLIPVEHFDLQQSFERMKIEENENGKWIKKWNLKWLKITPRLFDRLKHPDKDRFVEFKATKGKGFFKIGDLVEFQRRSYERPIGVKGSFDWKEGDLDLARKRMGEDREGFDFNGIHEWDRNEILPIKHSICGVLSYEDELLESRKSGFSRYPHILKFKF